MVIGNFLLHPVDGSLEANGYQHLRWSDDILTFGWTIGSCQGSVVVLDDTLSDLRLARFVEKTLPFDDVYDARCNLLDPWLTSLTDLLHVEEDGGRGCPLRIRLGDQRPPGSPRDLAFVGYLESSKRNRIRTAAYHWDVIPHS